MQIVTYRERNNSIGSDMKENIPFPVNSSIKQHSVDLKASTAKETMRPSGKKKECRQSPSSPAWTALY